MCVLAKNSLRRPATTFARLTQSRAISRSIVFSSLPDQWEIRTSFALLFYFQTLFYCFPYHGDCRWLVVNFKIHLCSSGINSDLGECFLWGLCKRWSHQLTSDPNKCLLFLKMHACSLACVDLSESSFGAIQERVCISHGRPAWLHAHLPLVAWGGTVNSHFEERKFRRQSRIFLTSDNVLISRAFLSNQTFYLRSERLFSKNSDVLKLRLGCSQRY